jgi:hypothetical protein
MVVAGLATAFVVTACKGHDVRIGGAGAGSADFVKRDRTRTLGKGDIRIASQDSAVEVALVGDSIFAGLGARVLNKVDKALDTSSDPGDGFAASIAKTVKGAVAGALDQELVFPMSEISDIQADNGRLTFYGKGGKRMHMFERNNGRDANLFAPSDAAAFAAAFKTRKAANTRGRPG